MLTPEGILLLPRLRVQNANAISSPLTWGFPAPSAFTGFVHALSRRLEPELHLTMSGVAIVAHNFQPQVSSPSGKKTKVFHLTRNPGGKDGKPQAIVEEGRAHLELSLLVGIDGDGLQPGRPREEVAQDILETASSMRIAGGTILPNDGSRARPELHIWDAHPDEVHRLTRRLRHKLLPGFALVSREGMLAGHLAALRTTNPDATSLDALLELSSMNFDPPAADSGGSEWSVRPKPGWLVPVPAGYNSLSELYAPGEVQNTRDRETPFRFVEGIYTLGQWLSPHRVSDIRRLFWEHKYDPDPGTYLCTTSHFAAEGLPTEGI